MRDLTIGAYLFFLACGVVVALLPLRPTGRIASVYQLLDVVLANRTARVTLVVFWWWIGWHFVVAQTVDPPLG